MKRHFVLSVSIAGARPHGMLAAARIALATAALGTLLTAVEARATERDWVNAAGGTAGGAANWNPAATPVATDTLRFLIPGTYGVTFGVNVPVTNRFIVQDGTVSFQFNTPHEHTGSTLVGTSAASTPVLDITSGDLSMLGSITLGYGPGTNATMRVTGNTAHVSQDISSGSLAIGDGDALGTMLVRQGGSFETNSNIEIGRAAAPSLGTLRVTGESPGLNPRQSTFTALPNYSDVMRIGYPGVGVVEVLNGGKLDVQRQLSLAASTGSVGSLRVSGVGFLDSARVVISQDLLISRNHDNTAGGAGTVTLEPFSVVEVADSTILYDPTAGGSGTLTLSANSRFATGSLALRTPSTELVHPAGILQVIGGNLGTSGQALTVSSTTGSPRLELLSGARFTLTPTTTTGLLIGSTGTGRVNLRGGSSINTQSAAITLGSSAGGSGVLDVDASRVTATGALNIGSQSAGSANIRGGSTVSVGDLTLSLTSAGSGALTVTGSGTTMGVAGSVYLSGTASVPSGSPSSIVVNDHARLDFNRTGGIGFMWPDASIDVLGGGILGMDGLLNVDGRITVNGGSTDGGSFYLRAGSLFEAVGDINSMLESTSDTTMDVRLLGDALLGRSDQTQGYRASGTLIVNAFTATLRDADTARVGTVWLAGGTLKLPALGGSSIGTLTGSGRIEGVLRNRGTIAADASPGLSFTSTLESYGRLVSGTLRFLAGGGFRGRGTLSGSVHLDSGAVMINEGGLTLGNIGAPGVVDIAGLLDAGSANINCYAADSVRVSGTVELDQTTMTGSPIVPYLFSSRGRLQGVGTITTLTVMDGHVAPGFAGGSVFGTLSPNRLVLRSTSVLELEVGALALGQADKLTGTFSAALGGTLDVRRVNFSANPGDSVQIVAYPSVSGTFANLLLDGAPANGAYELHYRTDGVWLVFPANLVDAPDTPPSGPQPRSLRFAALGSPGRAPALELVLPVASDVHLEVFDLRGRRVATLERGALAAGVHRFARGLDDLPGGEICFARACVTTPSAVETRVVRLLRIR